MLLDITGELILNIRYLQRVLLCPFAHSVNRREWGSIGFHIDRLNRTLRKSRKPILKQGLCKDSRVGASLSRRPFGRKGKSFDLLFVTTVSSTAVNEASR